MAFSLGARDSSKSNAMFIDKALTQKTTTVKCAEYCKSTLRVAGILFKIAQAILLQLEGMNFGAVLCTFRYTT